jgi:hypothetical protein
MSFNVADMPYSQPGFGVDMYSDNGLPMAWNVASAPGLLQGLSASRTNRGFCQVQDPQQIPLLGPTNTAAINEAIERALGDSIHAVTLTNRQPQSQKKVNQRSKRARPSHQFNTWNARLNAKICKVSESGNLWELLDLAETHHSEMNIVNLSTIMHRAARMAKKSNTIRALSGHPQVARLRAKVQSELEMGSAGAPLVSTAQQNDPNAGSLPRCLATIAWSYATLQVHDERSFHLIAKLAVAQLSSLKAFELANLLWAFAKMHYEAPELFQAATHFIPAQLEHFTPVSLSMITWAYVTICHKPPLTLIRRLAAAFVEQLHAAKSQEIANMCWALATSKMAKQNVFQVLGAEAARKLTTFNIQELANTAWAFSRAGLVHVEFFEAMTELFIQKPGFAFRFHGQALANMMWSLAKQVSLRGGNTSKFQSIAVCLMPACVQVLERFKPQEFSSMLWSVAKLGFKLGNNMEADRAFPDSFRDGSAEAPLSFGARPHECAVCLRRIYQWIALLHRIPRVACRLHSQPLRRI